MTIKEQLSDCINLYTVSYNESKLESIVEDVAVMFAEFYADNIHNDKYDWMNILDFYHLFKKENNL